jgi:hypothetical protein
MKLRNKLMTLVILFAGFTAIAQDAERDRPTNKDSMQILPEKGDIAIGIQANQFLQYAGNIFGKSNSNNAPTFTGYNNTIFLKKFITENTAVRASVRLARNGNTRVYSDVQDDEAASDPLRTAQVQDAVVSANYNNDLGIALEKRRGYGRLQGFYGAGVSVNFGGSTNDFTYGNGMSSVNPRPSSYNGTSTTRLIKTVDSYVGAGGNAFIGVEYFIARKISLQGEIGWGINYNWQNDATSLYETTQNGARVEYSRNTGNDEFRSLNYDNNASSNIGFFFHF